MSDVVDLGGDTPCWAHLFADEQQAVECSPPGASAVDLGECPSTADGAIWSLPHGGDLDANLVRLGACSEIGAHVNDEVDVLIVVQTGGGELMIDDEVEQVAADHLLLIPKGSKRSITAGTAGITYLSIHRRRGPLTIKSSNASSHR